MSDDQGDNKGFQVCRKKMATRVDALCCDKDDAFKNFTDAVLNLRFDEEPKYAAYISWLTPVVDGPVERPLCVDTALRVCFRPTALQC